MGTSKKRLGKVSQYPKFVCLLSGRAQIQLQQCDCRTSTCGQQSEAFLSVIFTITTNRYQKLSLCQIGYKVHHQHYFFNPHTNPVK